MLGYCLLMYGRMGLGHEVTELDRADKGVNSEVEDGFAGSLEAGTQQRQEAQLRFVLCRIAVLSPLLKEPHACTLLL